MCGCGNTETKETKEANSKSERNARSLQTTHSQIFFQTVSRSLTLLFPVFSLTTSLSFVATAGPRREKGFYFALTVDFPSTQSPHSTVRGASRHCEHTEQGEPPATLSSPNTHPSFLGTKKLMWQLKATLPRCQPLRKKSTTTSHDQSCPIARYVLLCPHTSQPR